jgi:hypothetical protein
MVSSVAIAAGLGEVDGEERPRLIDQIAVDTQPADPETPDAPRRSGRGRRVDSAPPPGRGPTGDDLEQWLGSQLIFSISELAVLADLSDASIFRLLRLGLLEAIRIGGRRKFTRAVVLNFLRNGVRPVA